MGALETLRELESRLLTVVPIAMFSEDDWRKSVPTGPGVYAIWDKRNGCPVYVGQTSSLRSRMNDICRSENHTFPKKAVSLLDLQNPTETEMSEAISSNFNLTALEVDLGRAELEEYLILRWRATLVNKPAKRLLRSTQYQAVKAVQASTTWKSREMASKNEAG